MERLTLPRDEASVRKMRVGDAVLLSGRMITASGQSFLAVNIGIAERTPKRRAA